LQRHIKPMMRAVSRLSLIWLAAVLLFSIPRYVLGEQPTIEISSTIVDTSTAPPMLSITPTSIEGQNVVAAAELMVEFGFTAEAANVQQWLNDGKIFRAELDGGTMGETNPLTKKITIDTGTLPNFSLDRNNRLHFSWLLSLAAVLIHEKVHAHQSWWYLYCSTFNYLYGILDVSAGGREHPAEQDAWTKDLAFLDQVINILKQRIREEWEGSASWEMLLQLNRELWEALNLKIQSIRAYYDDENYGYLPYSIEAADELEGYRNEVLEEIDLLEMLLAFDEDLFGQIEDGLDSFMARTEPKVEEWLAGAEQRSSDAEGKVDFVGTIDSIEAMVAQSNEYLPGDWFGNRLVSNLFAVQGNPVAFDSPVVLVMYFDPQTVTNIDQINIYGCDPASRNCEKLANNRSVDQTNHTISVEVSSFSSFSMLGVFETSFVGGIAVLPLVAVEVLETEKPTGGADYGRWAGIAGGVAAGVMVLLGAAWYIRRRWLIS